MGVKGLWSILDPLANRQTMEDALSNRTLAVDLAGWAVSDNQCSGLASMHRPHIRNVFFRLSKLVLELNAWPIFVLDGRAPEIKAQVLNERRQRESQSQAVNKEQTRLQRNRLKSVLNECRQLLQFLGVETLQADSEAESLCASLNRANLVDAVLTEDSDVFCHGCCVVHRGFAKNQAYIETYETSRLAQSELRLSRDKLLFLAIVCGCDYHPSGVPNLGKETVLKLFKAWPRCFNAITELETWIKTDFEPSTLSCQCSSDHHCLQCIEWQKQVGASTTTVTNSVPLSQCRCQLLRCNSDSSLLKVENSVKQKLASLDWDFWHETFPLLLNEFDLEKDKLPSDSQMQTLRSWRQPQLMKTCIMLGKKLGWEDDYAFIKVWPLLTRWHVLHNHEEHNGVLTAIKVVKKKKLKGVNCVVIEWKPEEALKENLDSFKSLPNPLLSIEPSDLVSKTFASLWEDFTESLVKKKKKTKTTRTKRKRTDVSLCVSKKASCKMSTHKESNEKSQKTITQFLIKNTPTTKKTKLRASKAVSDSLKSATSAQNDFLEALSSSMMEDFLDESVDELSFIVDDIMSQNFNDMSIDTSCRQSKKKAKLTTSTPVHTKARSRTTTANEALPQGISTPLSLLQQD